MNEAIQQLKDAGFEKIVTNASSDPSWSEERWIVAEQSIAPGNNAYSASEIFSVSVMLRRRRVSRYLTSSSRESVCAIFQPTEEQLELFIEMFVGRLPEYIRNSLAKAALVA